MSAFDSELRPRGRLLKLADVIRETSLSSSTIYRRIADRTFPAPQRIGSNRVAWPERTLEEWKADPLNYHAK